MITHTLTENILNTGYEDFPDKLIQHAKRSILNWMGVAIGASTHESVEMVLELKEDIEGSGQVSILGRLEKADILLASLINGMSSNIFGFDDTHLNTIHHPSAPVTPVVFALGESMNLSGKEILRAFILGCEAELRISNAVYPSHYQKGWHITSTTGTFGSAIAAGVILGLNEVQMRNAIGIAGTQAFGLREVFGSMTKPFHPGKAAQNGLMAALLAKKGFTSSERIIEGRSGFANVLSTEHYLEKVNLDWGIVWEFEKNSFKPYACGIVIHPVIDACIGLRKKVGNIDIDDVKKIEVKVNPYVLELTGEKEPVNGLQAKFSVYHSGAIGFLEGNASQEQYEDHKVLDIQTIKLREKIVLFIDKDMGVEQAFAKLQLKNRQEYECYIEHATGSINNPMSQEALEDKFQILTKKIIGDKKPKELISLVMTLEQQENLVDILNRCK